LEIARLSLEVKCSEERLCRKPQQLRWKVRFWAADGLAALLEGSKNRRHARESKTDARFEMSTGAPIHPKAVK
jgi:hypothetical protein